MIKGFSTILRRFSVLPLAFFAVSGLAQTPPARPSTTAQPADVPPAAQQPAPTQQPAAGQQQNAQQYTITRQVNEVNLIFTVTDKHGHYIPNLKQSDFALLDDQKAPARVNSFRQQINLPLRVGVVIDASTSIRTRFQFEQQSATEFLTETVKPQSDRAFVMGFDVTPTITADWTNNLDALDTGINRLRPGGGTALFDAVYTACRDKLLPERGREPVRKAMILISDGDDNQSRVRPDEAIKMCERAETIIYAISTNWTPSRGKGDQVLSQMAEATGGEVFFRLPSKRWPTASTRSRPSYAASTRSTTRPRTSRPTAPSGPSSLLQRPPLPGARQERLFRPQGINALS